jgi:hypothetical protein
MILQILKNASPLTMLTSLLALSLVLAGLTAIYLAFGVRGARFDWNNPAEMNRTVGCLGSLAGFIFLPVCMGLFILPPVISGMFGLPPILGQAAGLLLGAGASLSTLLIALGLVEKRIPFLAET